MEGQSYTTASMPMVEQMMSGMRAAMARLDEIKADSREWFTPNPLLYPSPHGTFSAGVPVVGNEYMTERKQVRFPRSKKRRMRKKWSKNPANWQSVPNPNIYMLGGRVLVGHPQTIAKMATAIEAVNERRSLLAWQPLTPTAPGPESE